MRELTFDECEEVGGGFIMLLAAAPLGVKIFAAGAVFGAGVVTAIYAAS